jgi:hypothetical protein
LRPDAAVDLQREMSCRKRHSDTRRRGNYPRMGRKCPIVWREQKAG